MKTFIVCIAVIIGHTNTSHAEELAHLSPHRDMIQADFGGKVLELVNAPRIVYLPTTPPKLDTQGQPWSVGVRNQGPGATTVVGQGLFAVRIRVGQTVHVVWNGTSYSLK
jgi:hypothetical protein